MVEALSGGALAQLGTAYGAGLLTVLTPCIYPLIPVTISLFGVTAQLSRFKAFLLASSYVAGICLTYTVLGLLSAKAGILFGSMLGNFWVVAVLSLLFAVLALFSLELIQIPALGKLQNVTSRVGGKGYGGAFLMGTVSGFVAAPCAGPILAGILALAAGTGSTWWAGLLLFTYALGFGTVFIILGTFSGAAKSLPRPGGWMNFVKFITAAALFAVCLFLLRPFIGWLQAIPISPVVGGVLIAASLVFARISYKSGFAPGKLAASLVFALTVIQLALGSPRLDTAGAGPGSSAHETKWVRDLDAVLTDAKAQGRPAMVDFFAEWCAACKELDALTFPDPAVREKLRRFTAGKLDFTTIDDPQQALMDKYGIIGLPAILFLRPDGTEIPNTRITGFLPPPEFIKRLDEALVAH